VQKKKEIKHRQNFFASLEFDLFRVQLKLLLEYGHKIENRTAVCWSDMTVTELKSSYETGWKLWN